jgi:hypothetical protein
LDAVALKLWPLINPSAQIPSFVGTIVLLTVQNKNTGTKAGLLLSYYMVLSFWAAQTLAMSMISRNVAGQTKKSVVVAMVSCLVGKIRSLLANREGS